MLTDAILTDFGGGLVQVGVADTPPIDPGAGRRWSGGPRGCVWGLHRCPDDFYRPNDALRGT